ncbi:MAG: helix-turn-helix domain-containing protein [Proteobacteria bacterium]|nr:helix-turn-helix domain-containing protein [Pseudomonadota bacterium]
MKKVTVLGIKNALATTISGPLDFFSLVGSQWNYKCGINPSPYFNVELTSMDGKPIHYFNNLVIQPQSEINDIESTDLIILPCIAGFIEESLEELHPVYPWLWHHYKKGTYILGICSGAFLMAEAGLLDGKLATTHWSYHDQFVNRYPDVKLDTNQLVTRDGILFCAGGTTAWMNLCLYLIKMFYGQEVAIECSKALVLRMSFTTQTPFSPTIRPSHHNDPEIQLIQDLIENNFHQSFTIEDFSERVNMCERNFKRRFKEATGYPPIKYIQMIRVEKAKRLLEQKSNNIDEIAINIGYEDSSFFRKIFKRYTGLTPKSYQKLFSIKEI